MNVNEYIEKYSHHHFQGTKCGEPVKDAITIMDRLGRKNEQLKETLHLLKSQLNADRLRKAFLNSESGNVVEHDLIDEDSP